VILVFAFNTSPQAQSLKKIIFSAKGGGEAMLPFVISQRLGFYKEEGLQSEVVVTRGTIATQALIGGSVGYTNAAVLPAVFSGARLKIILNSADKPAQYLVASPKITSLKQLAGKTVAISDFSGQRILNHARSAGQDRGTDCRYQNAGLWRGQSPAQRVTDRHGGRHHVVVRTG
jgi:ABC-type nitrate/sulfonate/bicarbonate transport system substrate-binding protein